jgi:phage-related protein
MTASLTTALSAFAQAVTNVGVAILNAALAVFHAIIALFSEVITGVLQIGQALVKLATDLLQDTLGFIFGALATPSSGLFDVVLIHWCLS